MSSYIYPVHYRNYSTVKTQAEKWLLRQTNQLTLEARKVAFLLANKPLEGSKNLWNVPLAVLHERLNQLTWNLSETEYFIDNVKCVNENLLYLLSRQSVIDANPQLLYGLAWRAGTFMPASKFVPTFEKYFLLDPVLRILLRKDYFWPLYHSPRYPAADVEDGLEYFKTLGFLDQMQKDVLVKLLMEASEVEVDYFLTPTWVQVFSEFKKLVELSKLAFL